MKYFIKMCEMSWFFVKKGPSGAIEQDFLLSLRDFIYDIH